MPQTPKVDVKHAVDTIKGSVAQPFALPRKPRTDAEAQRLYFHIRTLCFWLDAASDMIAIPFLQPYMNKLPFSFGVEAVLGTLLPVAGDIIGFFVSLYVVLLCMQFGLPAASLWKMLVNCIIDVLVGIIPIIGDLVDLAFKSNLRNLQILEDHLLSNQPPNTATSSGLTAPSTHLSVKIPPSGSFWPKSTAPEASAFYKSADAPYARQSFFTNIFGSSAGVGSGSTQGWKLGGAKKVDIEQVGGWSGESAHLLYRWIIAVFAKVAGKTQQAASSASKKKKAY
ncbi:hypothetical protein EMMF5_000172 [Cystobasidiomycetes sp. EMM_F5]